MIDASGEQVSLEGGLVIAGDHAAFACSRLPQVDDALQAAGSLEAALASGAVSEAEIESYEVSIATGGRVITHSTQPARRGQAIDGSFSIGADGRIVQDAVVGGAACMLLYEVDVFEPDFSFTARTPCTPEARNWMDHEAGHLLRHAVVAV